MLGIILRVKGRDFFTWLADKLYPINSDQDICIDILNRKCKVNSFEFNGKLMYAVEYSNSHEILKSRQIFFNGKFGKIIYNNGDIAYFSNKQYKHLTKVPKKYVRYKVVENGNITWGTPFLTHQDASEYLISLEKNQSSKHFDIKEFLL